MSTSHTAPLTPPEVIRRWMDHFGLSESDVAHKTGLPINTVTRLLRGNQRITGAIAAALAAATTIAAERWLALQRHHAARTRRVNNTLDALARHGIDPGYGQRNNDKETTMSTPQTNGAPEIPLYGTAAHVREFADRWAGELNISGGTIGTATVLAQLAAMMRDAGISYISAADLDGISAAVHPTRADLDTRLS